MGSSKFLHICSVISNSVTIIIIVNFWVMLTFTIIKTVSFTELKCLQTLKYCYYFNFVDVKLKDMGYNI